MSETERYYVWSMKVKGVPMWYVADRENNSNEVYRSRNEGLAVGRAQTLNRTATQIVADAAPATKPAANPMPAGWSNAARRRSGHSASRSHPLGTAVERGAGYTVYEDEAFGGGRVQIWDES